MPVDIKAVKQYLTTPALYYSIYAEKKERYQSLFDVATKTTTHITGMPGGGNSDKEKVLASLTDSEEEYIDWFNRYLNKKIDVFRFICDSNLPLSRKRLLCYRYVDATPWKEIISMIASERMVSSRQVYREHNRALQLLTDWVNSDAGTKYKKEIFL